MVEWISAGANVGMLFVTLRLAKIASRALEQISEMKTQNQNDAIGQLYTRMFEIQKIIMDKPDIVKYLSGEMDDLKGNIYLEMYADFLEQIVLQVDLLPSDAKIAWECYIYDTLKKYTTLKAYIETHLEKKSGHLSEKIQKYINQEKPCYEKLPLPSL